MHKHPAMTAAEIQQLIAEGVPLVGQFGLTVTELGAGRAVLRQPYHENFIRPGGVIAGPAMFGLADVALYAAVLSLIGRVELAVTTSMTINFLRKSALRALAADARILKPGRRLVYGDVLIYSEGDDDPVAHATGTYSIPPQA